METIQEGTFRPASKRPTSRVFGGARAFLTGLLFGAMVAGGLVYTHMTHDYIKVYKTNIGGFVFYNNKIYNLSELKNL